SEGPPLLLLLAVTGIVLLLSHGLDLYDSDSLSNKLDLTFRLLMVLGLVAFSLAAVAFVYRQFRPGRDFLPGAPWGLGVLTITLVVWRALYSWTVQPASFRARGDVFG